MPKNQRLRIKCIELDWFLRSPSALATLGERRSDYVFEVINPGFPPRKNIKYCVRLNDYPESIHYKAYDCYCWIGKKWFKFKKPQYLFTDIHVPQVMSHYEYLRYKSPLKLLSKQALTDWHFHEQSAGLRKTVRGVQKEMLSTLGKPKPKKKKTKKK